MTSTMISEKLKKSLKEYLSENPFAELVQTYLFFIEKKYNIQAVLFPPGKKIYESEEKALKSLEADNKVWHETEIKISFSPSAVNENTKKIYICPFSGKVFGDNTHPNPQDAIYDHVAKCPENNERVGGLKSKRFFVSEDPEVIKSYIPKVKPKEAIKKVVYSSVLSGKLFNTKEAVIADFKKNYLKPMTLFEVQNQNRFEIGDDLLAFIQKELTEEKVTEMVEALSEDKDFKEAIDRWIEE
ncbi:MAG: DUF2709 domain-containing protein [Chlamydiia bacterium]|nr:DUF2709 domain-containing protein [Chlamydiia bacterium]